MGFMVQAFWLAVGCLWLVVSFRTAIGCLFLAIELDREVTVAGWVMCIAITAANIRWVAPWVLSNVGMVLG